MSIFADQEVFTNIYSTPETELIHKSIPAEHVLIDQEALQERLNNAYEKGFKDGSKAANLIADLRIKELNNLIDRIHIEVRDSNDEYAALELIEKFRGLSDD